MTNIPYLSSWKRLVSGLKRGPLTPYDPGQNTLHYQKSSGVLIHTDGQTGCRLITDTYPYVEDVSQRLPCMPEA